MQTAESILCYQYKCFSAKNCFENSKLHLNYCYYIYYIDLCTMSIDTISRPNSFRRRHVIIQSGMNQDVHAEPTNNTRIRIHRHPNATTAQTVQIPILARNEAATPPPPNVKVKMDQAAAIRTTRRVHRQLVPDPVATAIAQHLLAVYRMELATDTIRTAFKLTSAHINNDYVFH